MGQSGIGPTGASTLSTPGDSTVPDRPISRVVSGEVPEPVAEAQINLQIDRSEPMDTEHVNLTDFGSGTLVPRGMDRRPFGGVFGRLGILGDSDV